MKNAGALLNQFLGQGGSSHDGLASGASSRGGAGDMLQGMLSGKGGLATGAVAGGLAGLLMGGKKPKKMAKKAAKVGGVALLGGLAYTAYKTWQNNNQPGGASGSDPAAPGAAASRAAPVEEIGALQGTAFMPEAEAAREDLSTALIRAMISAAKADGHIDAAERARISEQLKLLNIDAAHQSFLEQELDKPMDIDAVAASVSCPEQAAEIYLASLLVVDSTAPAERGYLAMLSARLGLDPALVEQLHTTVEETAHRADLT